MEEIAKSTEDLISQINEQTQTDDLFEHPLRELLALDKQLRSIRGFLKVEIAKRLSWVGTYKWKRSSLEKSKTIQDISKNNTKSSEKD